MLPEDQVVRYARVGGRDVAWSATGTGPTLVMGGWWSSHLIHDWSFPEFRRFVERLARHRTVIRYDPPGTGLSRGAADAPATLTEQSDALAAVIDAASDGPVALLAGSSGCPVAVAYAAAHPASVDRLVLYGGYLRGTDIASPDDRSAMTEVVRRHWGISTRVLTDILLPDATAAGRDQFARFQRSTATADQAASALEAVYEFDATRAAPHVQAPTLVLHRRGDRAIRFGLGQALAAGIPHAELQSLDGVNHFPWYGDAEEVLDRVLRFLGVDVPVARITPPTPLTAREQEIMTLVAEGLTDAQIATRLFLSAHTIHRHVANARAKLGVPSRAAAAAIVARQQP